MKGYMSVLCLSLLLGGARVAGAAEAIIDLSDPTKATNVTVVANDDGKTTETTVGGVKAVQTGGTADGTEGHLYLNVKDDLFKDSKGVWVRVDYYDQGTDGFRLEYDSEGNEFRAATPNPRVKYDTRVWTQQTFKLSGFNLQGSQPGGSDVRINDLGDGPEIISKVTITDQDPDRIQFPKNNPANPIVIDGVKTEGEWDGAHTVTLDRAALDALNARNWGGKEEFSGTYSFKWDETGLYVLGEVTDSTPRLNDAEPPNYFKGDGISQYIGLDQSDPGRTAYIEGSDFHVLVGMGETPRWSVEVNKEGAITIEERGEVPAKNLAIVNTDSPKGYRFELLIPWTLLKEDAKVTEGQEIAWTMFANNSKELPSSQQVAMSPFGRTSPYNNPSVWATAVLSSAVSVTNPPATPPATNP